MLLESFLKSAAIMVVLVITSFCLRQVVRIRIESQSKYKVQVELKSLFLLTFHFNIL